jgi:hypothetical protein
LILACGEHPANILFLQAAVMSVVTSYREGTVGGVFTCASNAL